MSATRDFDSHEVVRCLHLASRIAQEHHHQYVTLEHLTLALLKQKDVKGVLAAFKADPETLETQLTEFLNSGMLPTSTRAPVETETLTACLRFAIGQVMFSNREKVMPVDLLVAVLQQQDCYGATLLNRMGVTSLDVKRLLSRHSEDDRRVSVGGETAPTKDVATLEEAQALLGKYCVDLNEEARKCRIDPLIGREEEVLALVQIAARRTKNNTILVGDPGVGKTAIVEGLALRIVKQQVPEIIADAQVYSLDVANLVAGTRFRGDFEERVKQVLKALAFIDKPILFIDEVHTIIGAGSGSQGAMDVSNLLKPALAKGTLRCIGSTTLEEFRKHFEKDRALLRRFKRLDIHEPSPADSKRILRGLRGYYEAHHGITYENAALDAAVDLTHRHIKTMFLPDKAIDVIDNAGARQRILPEEDRKSVITVADIELEVSKVAKIPQSTVQANERATLRNLDSLLREQVYGQDEAIQKLTDAVQITRAGLRTPGKPSGCYLFSGPSGCGKTAMARQLAKTLGIPLVKFDMSEYMEKHSVSRLVGAPPGYVGHGDGGAGAGLLANAVDTSPNCVLLLDEVEKAHPDVFNVLLQVMDDARLTNAAGKTVHFDNVFLCMTTNAGAADMARPGVGFGQERRIGDDDAAIERFFAPEFRNRLDAIVKFRPLGMAEMRSIVDKFVRELSTMVEDRGLVVRLSDDARDHLARRGYDPLMGARPLARLIADSIKRPLARLLLFDDLAGDTVMVDLIDDNLSLTIAP